MSVLQRVLVTGGAGFIGSHLVERLVERGARITVIDNLQTGRLSNLQGVRSRIEWLQEGLTAALHAGLDLAAFDHIFHLAANPYIPPSVQDPRFDLEANLYTTFSLLEALRRVDARPRLVNVSSAAVYGNPLRLPMREDDPTFPISPYGVSKLAAERYAAVYSQIYGVPITSARLLSVYGPRQRKQVVYDLIARLHADSRELTVLGDGTQARDFTFVGDVVAALLLIAERAPGRGEVYNVGTGSTYSISALIDRLCAILGVAPHISYTGQTRQGDTQRWEVDISRLRELGYSPGTSFEEGLQATCEWYVDMNKG